MFQSIVSHLFSVEKNGQKEANLLFHQGYFSYFQFWSIETSQICIEMGLFRCYLVWNTHSELKHGSPDEK